MNLIEDWKTKWHKLWSIRLALLSALFGILEAVLPLISDDIPHGIFVVLSIITALWGAYARLVPQPKLATEATKPG